MAEEQRKADQEAREKILRNMKMKDEERKKLIECEREKKMQSMQELKRIHEEKACENRKRQEEQFASLDSEYETLLQNVEQKSKWIK